MMNYQKYRRNPVIDYPERQWPGKEIEKAPIWCSVDLRDGNQALVDPMVVEEKIEMFQYLIKLGFKEIEVGFPAASQIEFDFLRHLIEHDMIPDDVYVQVLTQCREELIARTFESIQGCKQAIVHIYNSTSTLQRDVVFHMDRPHIVDIAVKGTELVKKYAADFPGKIVLEYSPESFTGTELDFALEICTAVQKTWGATKENPIIINLPSTVEMNTPNVYADQIEWMNRHFENRESIILSIHPHNDRGTGVASAELALLAGAERVEGTLFGNGERTGNVDVLNIAYNMFSQGINPELEIGHVNDIIGIYERCCKIPIHPRHPYAGKLVFTAFSGSHQDAIAKGMAWREAEERDHWTVPYLPIDPKDIGRTYDKDVIRINSQSGKGGVSYILKQNFGISVPKEMREEVGYMVKDVSDKAHKELTPDWVYHIFEDHYVNYKGIFSIDECHFKQEDGIIADATISHANGKRVVTAGGNGRLDAVSNAIKQYFGISYELSFYEEHSLTRGSSSKACAYVGVICNGKTYWGVGIDADIIKASIEALTVAVNKIDELKNVNECKDERMVEIMNYIQANYLDVSLDDLAEKFFLSKPYLSKYIKEKSGMTFGDIVKKVRMKKARALLKSSSMTVENIALTVGYQNVEHFNRLFKKAYNITPVQFRNQK